MEEYYDTNVQDIEDLDIKLHSFIVIASKRASGKTILCKNIIKNLIDNNDIHHILIYSKTCQFNGDYDFIDKKYMYDYENCEEHIKNVMNYQKEKIKKNNISKNPKNIENILMIFDDVNVTKKNYELINLSTLARHFKITVILSIQYPKGLLSSSIRGNINYLFFNDLNYEAEDAILKSVHIPFKYNEFHKFIDEHNSDYQFIMYNNNEKDKKKRLKIVKAKMIDFEFF